MSKRLAVFDFDHTIIDDNTDTVVVDMLGKDNIPQEVRDLQHREGWTSFMQGVFKLLHEKGATREDITSRLINLPLVDGMPNLIRELTKMGNYDKIIISDSNTYFIKACLQKHKLDKAFMKIFTNPAEFVEGRLMISPYHHQTDCKLSTVNLCKGQILDEFIENQRDKEISYDRVIFIGDGAHDFCPVLRLNVNDVCFARNKYKLEELIRRAREGKSFDNSTKRHHIKAEVIVWDSGDEILQNIKK